VADTQDREAEETPREPDDEATDAPAEQAKQKEREMEESGEENPG
jgi:hypothetical protein